MLGDVFRHGQEGEGDDEVEDPVDGRGDGVASTSGPHRVDLGVDRPGHRSQSCNITVH